jgi:sulfur carrier protein ThiS
MISITVHLHTILQRETPEGLQRELVVEVPEDCTMNDLLELLEIELSHEALLLAVNGRIAGLDQFLIDGDQVRIMPAMSGG